MSSPPQPPLEAPALPAGPHAGRDRLLGALLAGGAFTFWGIIPPFWKLLGHVSQLQVIAHRVVWTCAFTAAMLGFRRGWAQVGEALSVRRTVVTLVGTGVLITVNWGIYIVGVVTGQLVSVSMGYFINPLVSMLLGVAILRERLRPWQTVSVLFAFAGVLYLGIGLRALPWIAVSLAFTFGIYGLLRKTVAVESLPGTFLESAFVLPGILAYLAFVTASGQGAFGSANLTTHLLLVLGGPVSAVPLLLFAAGARRIPLSTVGFLQYVAPTGHLLLGVLAFGEPFTRTHLISFALIWTGVLMYAISTARGRR